MPAGGDQAEAVQSDPRGREPGVHVPSRSRGLESLSLHFSFRSKSSTEESSTCCHFPRACGTKHSMLVNVELAEHFRQEPLKPGRLTFKVRLLLITPEKKKKSTEILFSDRSTLKHTHVSLSNAGCSRLTLQICSVPASFRPCW